MASKNEFGVESSSGSGFGIGVGDDFEDMFEEATAASVVDDEVSDTRRRPATPAPVERDYFNTPNTARQEPAPVTPPAPSFSEEPAFTEEQSYSTPIFDEIGFEEPSFASSGDVDDMFATAEGASVADDEVRDYGQNTGEPELDAFDDFGAEPEPTSAPEPSFSSYTETPAEPDSFSGWTDPALDLDPEPSFSEASAPVSVPAPVSAPAPAPAPVVAPAPVSVPEPQPEPVYYQPTVTEPVPSVVPEPPVAAVVPAPVERVAQRVAIPTEGDVDYIERVILTSDAIRELEEEDAKAVNMFVTAGSPVETHQELVLTALLADRQILKTAEAILDAKIKSSVDMAFHILGLDEATFVDFGKILSHDLQSTQTVIFEGDRLQYARKLVDVVEALPAVSIKRFEAVKSVLGAGELSS